MVAVSGVSEKLPSALKVASLSTRNESSYSAEVFSVVEKFRTAASIWLASLLNPPAGCASLKCTIPLLKANVATCTSGSCVCWPLSGFVLPTGSDFFSSGAFDSSWLYIQVPLALRLTNSSSPSMVMVSNRNFLANTSRSVAFTWNEGSLSSGWPPRRFTATASNMNRPLTPSSGFLFAEIR